LAREASTIHAGTYSAKIGISGGTATANQYGQIYQDAVTWDDTLQGATITVTCYVHNADITNVKGQLIIDDGVGTTTANSASSSAFELVTCTRKLDASATRLRIIMRALALSNPTPQDTYTYFDALTFPTTGTRACHADFDDDMVFSQGCLLLRVNNSTSAVTYQGAFPSTITDLVPFQVSGADYLIVFLGTSASYYYMDTAEAFTLSTAVVKTFQFGAWVNTTADTLYANDTNNSIRSTTNPLNAGVAWSAATTVGADANDIIDLRDKDGALLIEKEDMPYYLDSSGVVKKDLAPECASGISSHSGKNSTIWLGEYFRPTGSQSLLRIGTSNEWIQPSKFTTNNSDFTGQVDAVCGDEEWLYTLARQSNNIITNGNFENNITTWTEPGAGATAAQSSTQAKIGTYSLALTRSGADCNVGQAISSPISYQGKTLTLGAWVYATVASRARLAIAGDVSGTLYSSYHSGVAGWEFLTVSISLTTDTAIMAYLTLSNGDTTAYFDGVVCIVNSSIDTPTNPYYFPESLKLLCGREETIDDTTSWVWHPIACIPLNSCETAWISNVYKKRLWISSTDQYDSLYYMNLPTMYGDITGDANRSFLTNSSFITPWLHGDFKRDSKSAVKVTATLGHAYDANIYWECHLQKLGDTSWTDLGDLKGSASSRTPSLYISTATTSSMFRLKFVAITNSTSSTPILLDYAIKTLLYPDIKNIVFMKLRLGETNLDKNGQPDPCSFGLKKTCLANLRTATWVITVTQYFDISSGTSFYGRLLPLPQSTDWSWRKPVYKDNGSVEWEYNVLLLKVPLA
jgi:hypothetical protein